MNDETLDDLKTKRIGFTFMNDGLTLKESQDAELLSPTHSYT
jgi:hypothetical protein